MVLIFAILISTAPCEQGLSIRIAYLQLHEDLLAVLIIINCNEGRLYTAWFIYQDQERFLNIKKLITRYLQSPCASPCELTFHT